MILKAFQFQVLSLIPAIMAHHDGIIVAFMYGYLVIISMWIDLQI